MTRGAVVGDLNDTPGSDPIKPLTDSDLRDAFGHPAFDQGGYPGTYGSCTAFNEIDDLFLSQRLNDPVQSGGVFRKGMWPGREPKKWEAYAELRHSHDAASDHAAPCVDLDR